MRDIFNTDIHPWYDYVIVGLSLAFVAFVFGVRIFVGIVL